ncbi:unnamed protein product [Schistosoma mattheei]|uniref:Uncharacterized protein n=1 Tax=Schistosoma mattheei TaxID=31246 RepID=A0AA85BTH5_9TREM|nr:unnamed protein product [Schistosoma mattheei]
MKQLQLLNALRLKSGDQSHLIQNLLTASTLILFNVNLSQLFIQTTEVFTDYLNTKDKNPCAGTFRPVAVPLFMLVVLNRMNICHQTMMIEECEYGLFAKRLSKVNDNNKNNQSHFLEHNKALMLNNAPVDPTSKLDCFALKCPASLKTVAPLCELKNNLKVQKPNPNINNIVPRRETFRTMDKTLRQANGRLESMKIEVNAPDPLMRDDFCSHDVASRVKAFKALMKSEELEGTDQNSETKSIRKVTDERKISDVSYQENHIGLRRSKTFSGEQMSRRYQKHYLQYMDLCFDCGNVFILTLFNYLKCFQLLYLPFQWII